MPVTPARRCCKWRAKCPRFAIPLWNGLRLSALAIEAARENLPARYETATMGCGLKDMETAMIHKAVEQARGNVAQAAQALGISRATVYRKLGAKTRA